MAAGSRLAYNAGMGNSRKRPAAVGLDAWLRKGGRVVAASERATRAVEEDFHRARRAEGLTAWAVPAVEPWTAFVRSAWDALSGNDDRLVMNSIQEQALWTEIVASSRHGSKLLEPSLQRLAGMAAKAHALLCAYAPQLLNEAARSNWQQDAAACSEWLLQFDRACASKRLVSVSRLPLELAALLEKHRTERAEILLTGFDRLQPTQELLLTAWGPWRQAEQSAEPAPSRFYTVADEQSELKACARWCKQRLAADENARLLVVTRDLPARRGELERAYLRLVGDRGAGPRLELSLGVPLGQIPLARAGRLLLAWLDAPIAEHELDWLLGSGQAVVDVTETYALTGFMRALRQNGLERTRWSCEEFLRQRSGAGLPEAWRERMRQALRQLAPVAKIKQSPLEWADFIQDLLQTLGWPGERTLTSEEFQTQRRWQHVLDMCGSLGFDGRRMTWRDFLKALGRTLDETLFAPESQEASIIIAGPAESAGLTADAIWFMGVNEETWPAAGAMHPLIDFGAQREYRMPHATPQQDWDLAHAITARLLAAAPEVCFSYARQVSGVEMRPSRLVAGVAGEPQELPEEWTVPAAPLPLVEPFEDFCRVPFAADRTAGGSALLSAQSQCPFKAFASVRLNARGWKPAEAGLTAAQRGQLLHEVLHAVWSPDGIRSHAELLGIADLREFVAGHVRTVMQHKVPAGVRERMPRAYLVLEEERLAKVVTEWLEFERTRAAFTVAETEVDKDGVVAGLALKLRLDRIDRLNNGKLLVIDYKTGRVTTSAWEMPRPEDVQLPLYADFALGEGNEPGGLVFAKVRTGEHEFAGFVEDAVTTLLPHGIERKALARKPLTRERLENWRGYIEKLARDFLAGRADVDPIDRVETCKNCDLQALCRIDTAAAEEDADETGEDADDE